MVKQLTTNEFKEIIFDYTEGGEWKYMGNRPAVIDYFASWCSPCKMIAPILDELSEEYPDIDFYKIDTEEENELAAAFNVRSIPFLLLIPVEGEPKTIMGAVPKQFFKDAFKEVFGL